MSAAAPLQNRMKRAAGPAGAGRPGLRPLIAAMVAATVVISQFGLNWGRPEDGILVGLSLGAFMLVPNGIAWTLGPVLICELSIASYYFADYGLSLRLIVTGLAMVLALPTILSSNRADPRYRRVFIPAMALLIIGTIGNLAFSGEDYTIKYLRYQVLQILALVLVACAVRTKREIINLAVLTMPVMLASAFVAVWQHYARGSALGSDLVTIWKGRSTGLAGSPVLIANQLTAGLVPLLGLLASLRWRRDRWLAATIMAALVLALGIYFTYTRSAPLALAPGLLAMGLCLRGQRRLIMVGGVVGAAAMFQLLAGTGLIGSRYYLGAEDDNSAASHDALLQVALAIALDNPISGVGHEHFEELSLEYAGELDSAAASNASLGVDRPHNDFLTVWISWGIAALVAYVFLFLGAIKNFVAAARAPDPLVAGLAVGGVGWLATYAANSAFHNYLDSSTLLWVFAGLSVVLARLAERGKQRQGTKAA
ncbi:MAG: O-antigen ligase family protein [Thermomicrobiales bacterium]